MEAGKESRRTGRKKQRGRNEEWHIDYGADVVLEAAADDSRLKKLNS